MALTSIGDQSRLFLARNLAAGLRGRADRLGAEMATGLRQSLRSPGSAELGQLLSLRRDQRLLESYRVAASEAATRAQATQTALQTLAEAAGTVAPGLTLAAAAAEPGQMATAAATARAAFLTAVSTLNGAIAGVSLFSGLRSDGPALIGGEAMLAALSSAAAGQVTAQGLSEAVTAWFGPGGGYEGTAFLGDPAPMASRIDGGDSLELPVSALDPGARALLGGLAVAALSGQLASDPAAQAGALNSAGGHLLSGQAGIIETRARLGLAEARIDGRIAEVAARKHSLGQAELSIAGVDPYAAATAFEEAATRLDTVLAVTARLSRLSLLEHIR